MSDQHSPVELMFEMQRDTIKQTEDVIGNLIDISTDISESFAGGIETQREFQEQTLELTRESVHRSLDAAETVADTSASVESVPSPAGNVAELRDTVDRTFDSLLDQQEQAFDTVEGQYDEFSDEALDGLQNQVEMLLELNERVETQLVDSAERFVEQAEEADVLSPEVQEQVQRLADRFEEQAERFSDLESRFETIEIDDN